MAVILKGAGKLYYYLNEDIADERIQEWPLMRTPWPGLTLLALYLFAVYKWLPDYMSKRPPYDLRFLMAIYNIIQIIGCVYVFYQSLTLGWLNQYSLVCQPVNDGPHSFLYAWRVCYIYFVIKIMDLLDTIFFVLRKKQNQVTFLHVYHHCGMVAVAWGIVKWVPGGHVTLMVTINSFVHIVMYVYYLLTTWDESYKRSLWWKKHVTQVQIIQFSIILIHFLALLATQDCAFPRQPIYILLPQNLFIFILFCDFYYKAYISKPKVN
ncbi:unnamed protein product [Chilo suppressalis]|uniref:Elongation of very long chain fatty acids protein n=1 Tax=Chilo suppressalis TaxID=168631 RepID=A0ABN8L792_CHISP|nr:unnamed protein product [Chilo suppressalis]